MSDLRKAAEELMPILDRWKMTYPPCSGADWDKVEALRTALAQPEQEPVAWVCRGVYSPTGHCPECQPLYTAPPSIEAAILAEREACAEWLRDNYQDYKNIADICEAIRVRGEK